MNKPSAWPFPVIRGHIVFFRDRFLSLDISTGAYRMFETNWTLLHPNCQSPWWSPSQSAHRCISPRSVFIAILKFLYLKYGHVTRGALSIFSLGTVSRNWLQNNTLYITQWGNRYPIPTWPFGSDGILPFHRFPWPPRWEAWDCYRPNTSRNTQFFYDGVPMKGRF